MTLAKRIEFRCSVEGEVGVVAVKMERECLREGSEKEGKVVGLIGEGGCEGDIPWVIKGGNSTSEDNEGTGNA